ncbi:amino acid adenylation domain-containing protein [Streptomyces sp. NPDC127068]|uniref:amino acid adenylation domain-containing protein n=1 Tax=Streptomyces sp. NPDC127068 TaxID=3347127 RepID=UPI003662BC8C
MTTDPAAGPDDLSHYLDRTTARLPNAPAVFAPDGTVTTYRELHQLSGKVAAFLSREGVRTGDRVALQLPKSAETVALMLGALRAGAAYVPIDVDAPPARTATVLSDCAVRVLFTTPDALGRLDAKARRPPLTPVPLTPGQASERLAGHLAWADVLASDGDHPPATVPDPGRLAYLLYTSGSTGTPKGVAVTHRNAVSFVEWATRAFAVTADDRLAAHAPFHFDLSVFDVYAALRTGASVHLIDTELAASPRHLARFVATHDITVWYSTPTVLGAIGALRPAPPTPAGLRLVLFAGEVFPPARLRRIKDVWPEPAYHNLYGPTETNVVTHHPVPRHVPPDRHDPYPIGAPCSHCEVILVDGKGVPVVSDEGFLAVSGPSVFPGYWQDGRAVPTEAHFTTGDGRLWFNTGDLVRREEDAFVFVGRRDRMVKRHGYRIELDEIERTLAAHPELIDAAVVVSARVDDQPVVSAYVVARAARPSAGELRRYCRARLPHYLLPDRFQALAELPRTSTGKTDHHRLELQCPYTP